MDNLQIVFGTISSIGVIASTDENGFYLEYSGISRDDLLRSVSQSLISAEP